jgi:thiosulfate dehydrogenase [quinone] large subunit
MREKNRYTSLEMTILVLLRFVIGWHLLYEGFSKLLIPNWSSFGFLQESKWILAGFAKWITAHGTILNVVDFLNTWGLIAIGLGLILGLFTRIAAISGSALLVLYYLNNPPMIGLEYSLPSEGSYLIVNKTLIEAVSLVVLAAFQTSSIFGIDMFISNLRKSKVKIEDHGNGKQ